MITLTLETLKDEQSDGFLEFGIVPEASVVVVQSVAHEDLGTIGTFRVSLDAPSPPGGVTVNFLLSGSATELVDYEAIGTSVFIPESDTNKIITLTPIDDNNVLEGTETIVITLQAGISYTVGAIDQATMTLIDSESPKDMIHIENGVKKTVLAKATNDELLQLINELNNRITILEG